MVDGLILSKHKGVISQLRKQNRHGFAKFFAGASNAMNAMLPERFAYTSFSPKQWRWIVVLLLLVAVIGVYGRLGSAAFLNYDDLEYVTENAWVRRGITPEGVVWALGAFEAANWHPLTWISHMVDVALFGLDPAGAHWVNLGWHLANTLLLFALLRRLTGHFWASLLATALFALHPLQVESVAWVSERKNLLSTFFGLVAVGCYARYARRGSKGAYAGLLACFLVSLAAKPMFVTLPFALLLLDYWPLGRLLPARSADSRADHPTPRLLLGEKAPLLAMALGSCIVTLIAQHQGTAVMPMAALPLTVRIANAAKTYAAYLGKLLWPVDLYVPYPLPMAARWDLAVAALLLLAGITAVALWVARNHGRRYAPIGWLWFLGTLVPVIGLVQVGGQAMADRYAYVPFIGLFIVVAWGARDLALRPGMARVAVPLAGIALLVPMGWTTFHQTGYWMSSQTLFGHALAIAPRNYVAQCNLAKALADAGQREAAIEHYQAALTVMDSDATAHYNLAIELEKVGRLGASRRHYEQAAALDPAHADARNNLGLLLARQGDTRGALPLLRAAVDLRPGNAKYRANLARGLAMLGLLDESLEYFQRGLALDPSLPGLHTNMAMILLHLGRREEALDHLKAELALNPGDAAAAERLARLASSAETP
jgi:Flp pilus assembly protein TadD